MNRLSKRLRENQDRVCDDKKLLRSGKMSLIKSFTVSNDLGTVNLFALAIPMLLENIMSSMVGFINSAVLSGYSDSAVAATSSANTVINMFALLQNIVATGAGVVVCNYIGANDKIGTKKTGSITLMLCLLIGIILSASLAVLSSPLMHMMNLEGETLSQATVYFRIRTAFFFIPMINSALTTLLRCYGHSALTVITGFVTILFNLVLNIWVIRFPEYAPLTGVEGIAVGSVISQFFGLATSALFVRLQKIGFQKPDSVSDGVSYAMRILRIGLPSGVSTGAYSISQVVTASFIALIGMQAISAKTYYNNILLYSYLFSMCFGSANSLLIGRLVGAKEYERAKQFNKRLVKLTCLVNLCISLLIILLRRPLLSIFTNSEEIIGMAIWIFLIDAIAEQARGVSQVYEYALRGVGDMKFMMAITTVSCWTFAVGLAYFLSIHLEMGLVGCWIGTALDETVRAVFSFLRWNKGSWIKNDVLK